MKDNKEILNEAFFKRKKESYADKVSKTMPQYEPVDKKTNSVGMGSVFGAKSVNKKGEVLGLVDTDEAKRRLTGALGMVIGNNTIKGMADRAIKKFPIIVSEDIEPETVAMIKSLTEEQYADYINLMVSNQIIDLAEYEPNNPEGNIAIQALDRISGTDFSNQRIARKAQTGSLSADDIFANVPIYQLFRQESLQTGNEAVDSLLENALIVDNENKDLVCDYLSECMQTEYENILNEKTDEVATVTDEEPEKTTKTDKEKVTKADYAKMKRIPLDQLMNYAITQGDHNSTGVYAVDINKGNTSTISRTALEINKANSYMDRSANGLIGVDSHGNEIFNKLTNANVTIDKTQLDSALNSSVADILSKNSYLKDRFEKATFLLSSRRIAGVEYIDYCTKRLGIPVAERARQQIVKQFRIQDVRTGGYTKDGEYNVVSADDVKKIAANVKLVNNYITPSLKVKISDVAIGATVGAGITTGIGAAGLMAAGMSLGPLGWIAIAGAAGGAIGNAIIKAIKRRDEQTMSLNRTEGWERVESLIDQMDRNVLDLNLRSKKFELEQKKLLANVNKHDNLEKELTNNLYHGFKDKRALSMTALKEGYVPSENDFTLEEAFILVESELLNMTALINETTSHKVCFTESECSTFIELAEIVAEEIVNDKDALKEAIISTKQPTVVKKIKYDPKEFVVAPTFGTRNLVAYGSVEYDRKEIKDRRYNTPLLLTVKFKERYADGKYSDNELTAVIGILGIVTRVPSEEMQYVLKANANGSSIKDIFRTDGNSENMISDILSKFKMNREDSKLKTSSEVWHNLEKISSLAIANKLAGKATGNIANAHIIFSQKEIDNVRLSDGVDYLKDRKLAASLMKRYSAVTLMIANDISEKLYIFDDLDNISWNLVPYNSLRTKGGSDNVTSALNQIARLKL